MESMPWATTTENKVADLSKAMQQKVQFIAAVLHESPLLILDEPFTGLDPVNAAAVKNMRRSDRQQQECACSGRPVPCQAA